MQDVDENGVSKRVGPDRSEFVKPERGVPLAAYLVHGRRLGQTRQTNKNISLPIIPAKMYQVGNSWA